MRIAVSSTGYEAAEPAEERLGRCNYFLVFDEAENLLEVLKNDAALSAAEGAGIKSVQTLINHKVDVVLTGRVGPKAMSAIQAGGLAVYTGVFGTVAQSLKSYLKGEMQPLASPNSASHSGMGSQARVRR
ncbi:Predicted Fe-Mo cluster-binding protein, NifX family [Desulfotomaculum arcticum]|uniref:Predicted Fe-Mo cluster-binding protein, NifX family n=1 Tax=Desulfotruncus arcticus DSM 17038 TaxID=1121424 RepID=A0A1I2UXZ4_9FIRM|nr:NifB/NifX family molybdenum-iron cluster-binding protein [Desulfotruncus arcticus]SFG81984.1 Predicted Fe-Mo cluster-binding protein, NifX family [Desulfotomaculum arcticum] [Desulfotruncus arcticus DSM 17038]